MNALIFIITLFGSAALQSRLPSLTWLGSVRLEFLPALVVYGALTLGKGRAYLLAASAGFIQDALSAAPFGISALSYVIATVVMLDLREVLDRDLPWIQMAAGALTSLTLSLAVWFVIGISFGIIFKSLLLAIISGIITPLLFFAMDFTRYTVRAS